MAMKNHQTTEMHFKTSSIDSTGRQVVHIQCYRAVRCAVTLQRTYFCVALAISTSSRWSTIAAMADNTNDELLGRVR